MSTGSSLYTNELLRNQKNTTKNKSARKKIEQQSPRSTDNSTRSLPSSANSVKRRISTSVVLKSSSNEVVSVTRPTMTAIGPLPPPPLPPSLDRRHFSHVPCSLSSALSNSSHNSSSICVNAIPAALRPPPTNMYERTTAPMMYPHTQRNQNSAGSFFLPSIQNAVEALHKVEKKARKSTVLAPEQLQQQHQQKLPYQQHVRQYKSIVDVDEPIPLHAVVNSNSSSHSGQDAIVIDDYDDPIPLEAITRRSSRDNHHEQNHDHRKQNHDHLEQNHEHHKRQEHGARTWGVAASVYSSLLPNEEDNACFDASGNSTSRSSVCTESSAGRKIETTLQGAEMMISNGCTHDSSAEENNSKKDQVPVPVPPPPPPQPPVQSSLSPHYGNVGRTIFKAYNTRTHDIDLNQLQVHKTEDMYLHVHHASTYDHHAGDPHQYSGCGIPSKPPNAPSIHVSDATTTNATRTTTITTTTKTPHSSPSHVAAIHHQQAYGPYSSSASSTSHNNMNLYDQYHHEHLTNMSSVVYQTEFGMSDSNHNKINNNSNQMNPASEVTVSGNTSCTNQPQQQQHNQIDVHNSNDNKNNRHTINGISFPQQRHDEDCEPQSTSFYHFKHNSPQDGQMQEQQHQQPQHQEQKQHHLQHQQPLQAIPKPCQSHHSFGAATCEEGERIITSQQHHVAQDRLSQSNELYLRCFEPTNSCNYDDDIDSNCSHVEEYTSNEMGNHHLCNQTQHQLPSSGLLQEIPLPTPPRPQRPVHTRTQSNGSSTSWLIQHECTFQEMTSLLASEPSSLHKNHNKAYGNGNNVRSRSCSPIMDVDNEASFKTSENPIIQNQHHHQHGDQHHSDDRAMRPSSYLIQCDTIADDVGNNSRTASDTMIFNTVTHGSNTSNHMEVLDSGSGQVRDNSSSSPSPDNSPTHRRKLVPESWFHAVERTVPVASGTLSANNHNNDKLSYALQNNSNSKITKSKKKTKQRSLQVPPPHRKTSNELLTATTLRANIQSLSSIQQPQPVTESNATLNNMKSLCHVETAKSANQASKQHSDVSVSSKTSIGSKEPNADSSYNSHKSNTSTDEIPWVQYLESSELVEPIHAGYVSDSMLFAMAQMRLCGLTRDDRVGKYIRHEIGFVGLCCKHCSGQPGFGRYFPSTFNSFLNGNNPEGIANHIRQECRSCPEHIRAIVTQLYENERAKKHKPAHGFRKIFFEHIWGKLRAAKIDEVTCRRYSDANNLSANGAGDGHFSSAKGQTNESDVSTNGTNTISTIATNGVGSDIDVMQWNAIIGDSEIVSIQDRHLVPDSLIIAFSQMERCAVKETDRIGRFKMNDTISSGMCCKYCGGKSGKPGNGRYFPKSQRSLAQVDSCQQVVRHVASKCNNCPKFIRDAILRAISLEASDTTRYGSRYGSRTMFYRRVWVRLHTEDKFGVEELDQQTSYGTGESGTNDCEIPWDKIIGDSRLVSIEDRTMVPAAELAALAQMKPCLLSASDRVGRFKRRPSGMGGLTCKHCIGRPSNGRYFPTSARSFGQTTCGQTIMTHVTHYCEETPKEIRDAVIKLKAMESSDQGLSSTGSLTHGARKAFYERLWYRIQNQGQNIETVPDPAATVGISHIASHESTGIESSHPNVASSANFSDRYHYSLEQQQQQQFQQMISYPFYYGNSHAAYDTPPTRNLTEAPTSHTPDFKPTKPPGASKHKIALDTPTQKVTKRQRRELRYT